ISASQIGRSGGRNSLFCRFRPPKSDEAEAEISYFVDFGLPLAHNIKWLYYINDKWQTAK
ncbi:MAG: hypothetical protein J5584_02380, partial [Clostridia bacterium]|nr:hypothetical protein [Clostridia bacterium]